MKIRLASLLVRIVWRSLVVALVLVALLISLVRYSLPHLDNNKHKIENWLQQEYGVAVHLGSIDASWSNLGPSLALYDVKLEKNEQSPLALDIAQTRIDIDIWASLWNKQLHSTLFEMRGLQLAVDLAQMRGSEQGSFPIVEALETLFLEQLVQFSVTESRLTVSNEYEQQEIDILQLAWLNRDEHHQGVGLMQVNELANNSAHFVLDLQGSQQDLSGTFYAQAHEVDVSPWINELIQVQHPLQESRGNFVLWAGIEHSSVTDVQLQLLENQFSWQTEHGLLSTKIDKGRLSAIPEANGWRFALTDLLLEVNQQSLVSNWSGRVLRKGDLTLNLQTPLSLAPLLPSLQLLLNQDQYAQLTELAPQATVQQLALFANPTQFKASATVTDLGWQGNQDIPGISNLQAHINWLDNTGVIALASTQPSSLVSRWLPEPVDIQNVQANLHIALLEQGTRLQAEQIVISGDSLHWQGALRYHSEDDLLQLQGRLGALNMTKVKALLPAALMGQDTFAFLDRALQQGELLGGEILWHGRLNAYPFSQQQGLFQASLAIEQLDFAFQPDWPALTEAKVDLLFENDSLHVFGHSGKLLDADVSQAYAVIPELSGDSHVRIQATATAEAAVAREIIRQSSLQDTLSDVLDNQVVVSGPIRTQLDLFVPLTGNDVVADGQVDFANNGLYIHAIDAQLAQVNGSLRFVNERLTVEQLQGQLLGQPIQASLHAEQGDKGYEVSIDTQAHWHVAPLLAAHFPGWQSLFGGEADWQAQIDLQLNEQGFSYQGNLQTDLLGAYANLPAPFSKSTQQAMPVNLHLEGDDMASKVTLDLARQARFDGILPHAEMQFSRAHLSLGDTADMLPMGIGFSIAGRFEQVAVEPWIDAINTLVDGSGESNNPILTAPERIMLRADQATLAGQVLDNTLLTGKRLPDSWLMDVTAKQTRSQLRLFDDWQGKGIDIQAEYLALNATADDQDNTSPQDWSQLDLPPIRLTCQQCHFQDKNLGQVELQLSPVEQGIKIDKLQVNTSKGALFASGDWLIQPGSSQTHLTGEFASSDFGQFMQNLDLDTGIKDSSAKFDFDLSWQAAPHEFALSKLGGTVNWRLGDGYITEIADKGARIFSLFSLDSMIRKLSLDFRDIFAKGFFYDKIKGSLQLQEGIASTNDTVIDGAAGEMTLSGYTNLVSQELNYQIGFTPNLTSSLPILAYFMVNPAAALAAFALDEMLTQAKVIYHAEYALTGNWQAPEVTEVGKEAKDVTLSQQGAQPEATLDSDENNKNG